MKEAPKSQRDMLIAIHTILTDPNNGMCIQVAKLNKTVYGNGTPGLATQMAILRWAVGGAWAVVLMVGGVLAKEWFHKILG